MTIFRNPVEGAKLPFPLACEDVDVTTGLLKPGATHKCAAKRADHPKDKRRPFFKCPNRGRYIQGACDSIGFMYPRRWKNDKSAFHFHQGIDIMGKRGTPIQSVTAGTVHAASREYLSGYGGYGMVVVIESEGPDGETIWLLYAHCDDVFVAKGETVVEKQIIAAVGTTCFSKSSPTARFGDNEAHLHFEIANKRYPFTGERQVGKAWTGTGRLDPLEMLEKLGPWGMSEVYLPHGEKVNDGVALVEHVAREQGPGGYFPLGANNNWHGGVHVPLAAKAEVHAPFEGTIVAARLDSDPDQANKHYGSANFILLRHEIAEPVYQLFQGKDPAEVDPSGGGGKGKGKGGSTKPAVGRVQRCTNEPEHVITVKKKLHEHISKSGSPFYDPEDPEDLDDGTTVPKALTDAIREFQTEVAGFKNSDGVVDIPGKTWNALHAGEEQPEGGDTTEPEPEGGDTPEPVPLDPKRVAYCLLMHLAPVTIDESLAKKVPWLGRVKMAGEPPPEEPEPEGGDTPEPEPPDEEDHGGTEHQLEGAVGAPNSSGVEALNKPEDVEWVRKRLDYFDYEPGPAGSGATDELIEAIRALQNQHHKSFKKKKNGDGRVDTDGGTVGLLRLSKEDLESGKGSKGKGDPPIEIDAVFLEKVAERGDDGMTKVLTDLNVKVRSGEVVWLAGEARGFTAEGTWDLRSQVHWEIFSEHLIPGTWETPIEDDTDDLTVDAPAKLVAAVEEDWQEIDQDGVLDGEEVRWFYQSGKAEPLRRTPCRFVNQWALDVSKALSRIEDMGYEVEGLAERLEPFMWWDQAADVLPADRFVWHYNPIEFVAEYARHLGSFEPEVFDPKTHPTLIVTVFFNNGVPMPDQVVEVLDGAKVVDTGGTSDSGQAHIRGVPVGEYTVRVRGSIKAPIPITMVAEQTTEIEFHTEIAGPPPPTGDIRLIIRDYNNMRQPEVEVWITHEGTGDMYGDTTITSGKKKGEVYFEGVQYGEYTIEAGSAEPDTITLDKKLRQKTINLPRPIGRLYVEVKVGEAAGARQTVKVKKGKEVVAETLADEWGLATFDIPEGWYRVYVGKTKKDVKVKGNEVTNLVLAVAEKDAPEPAPPEEGQIEAWVHLEDEDLESEWVVVFDSGGFIVDGAYTDRHGAVAFALPPDDYTVAVRDETVDTRVDAFATTYVDLDVD